MIKEGQDMIYIVFLKGLPSCGEWIRIWGEQEQDGKEGDLLGDYYL